MNPKRILFYCDEYPPAKSGGIGSVTRIVAEGLVRKGYEITVAGSYEYGTDLPEISELKGVNIYRFTYFSFLKIVPVPLRKRAKSVLRKTGVLSRIAARDLRRNEQKIDQLLRRKGIEVMELVDFIALFQEIKQPVSLHSFSVPTTLRVHGSVSFLNRNRNVIQPQQLANDRMNFRRATAISAVSAYSRDFVNQYLLEEPREIAVIYNPVEEAVLQQSEPVKRQKTILFYGKITETKGAFQVIRAFQQLGAAFKDWNLELIGGGLLAEAKAIVQADFRERILFRGYVDRTAVLKAIDEAAFVVIPSYFENFSMAPLEVMARKTAIVYTRRTSGPEIIDDGTDGILVDPDDLQALTESMTRLASDEVFRTKLALAGYDKLTRCFTLPVILDQLEQHYQSVAHE